MKMETINNQKFFKTPKKSEKKILFNLKAKNKKQNRLATPVNSFTEKS
jgi:hypothetical protein